jgi:hypothetical protein
LLSSHELEAVPHCSNNDPMVFRQMTCTSSSSLEREIIIMHHEQRFLDGHGQELLKLITEILE